MAARIKEVESMADQLVAVKPAIAANDGKKPAKAGKPEPTLKQQLADLFSDRKAVTLAEQAGLKFAERVKAVIALPHAEVVSAIQMALDDIKDTKYGGKWPKRTNDQGKSVTVATYESTQAAAFRTVYGAVRFASMPIVHTRQQTLYEEARETLRSKGIDWQGKNADQRAEAKAKTAIIKEGIAKGLPLEDILKDKAEVKAAVQQKIIDDAAKKIADRIAKMQSTADSEAAGLVKFYGDAKTARAYAKMLLDTLDKQIKFDAETKGKTTAKAEPAQAMAQG